jgi:hypothetical protein
MIFTMRAYKIAKKKASGGKEVRVDRDIILEQAVNEVLKLLIN